MLPSQIGKILLVVGLYLGVDCLAGPVTQEQFLKQLKESHPLFAREKLTAQIESAKRSSLMGDQDWRVRSSMFFSHDEPAIAVSGPEKSDALIFSGGIERRFWSTGGNLSASFSSSYASLDAESFLGLPDSYFQNELIVAYNHPLLQNKRGKLDRLAYDLKQFDIDISEVTALENEEVFVAQAASRFLDWVLLTAQLEIISERLRLSEEELSRTEEKRDANLIDEVDVIRAEDAVRVARQNLLLVESQWKALQAELAVLVQDAAYYDASPSHDLYQTTSLPSLDRALAQLKTESRLLKALGIRLDQLKVVRSGFLELKKPSLSLMAQVGIQSAETAWGNSMALDKPNARIGLQLGFPVENRAASARVVQNDLESMQLEKQLERLNLDLASAVANVHTRIEQLNDVLELNREQIESARAKTEEELKLYEQGRGELTFVIQSRDSEQAAKLTYALNALSYQKLLLEYRALMDQLHFSAEIGRNTMKSFFRFFAERHKLATLITIMIILLGLSTLTGIKRDIYPHVDFGMVSIMTRYPGASPEDVELNVTNKIEEELKSITGIDNTTSISMENVSAIIVTIDIDASDQDDIKNKIREAVGRVTDLPPEVTESPRVTELNSSLMDVIEVGLAGDVPYRELREQARLLEKKLKNVPGVARLDKFGYRAREIKVEVSPRAAGDYQVPLREIIAAIRGRNIRGTTGSFESYTSEKNLVTLAQFQDPLEVGNVIVRSTFDGPAIRVNDLAEVRDDFEDERVTSRLNGKEAISFLVFISETADAIRACDAIKELVAKERETLPEEVEIMHINDESRYVRDSFDVVLSNGWIGLLLVLVLLTIFLNFRTAFWVALGIPVALLGTIFLLPVFGMYLDTITLSGMILVIGIIVDDAIIIAENIARRREKGDAPLDAAVEGIREVFRPVITTILTTFLVFAPMFFMPGLFGKYIVPIPLAITLALFISLGEAMVALPAHLTPGLRRLSPKATDHGWFDTLRTRYRSAMTTVLRFRYLLAPVFVIALAGSLWFAGNYIKFVLFPSDQADSFYMLIELPTGTSLEATSDKLREIEAIVADLPPEELASFNTRIGTNYSEIFVMAESENYAALRVRLTPYSERSRNANQIVEELRRQTDQVEGIDEIIYGTESGGPPVGKPVNIRIVGSDDALRKQLTDSVETFLASMSGVKDISRDDKPGKDQVEIQIDYDRLSRLGLTVADVAQNVRIAYDGEVVTSVRYGDEEVDFRIIMEERARKRLDYLQELAVPNRQGRLIPLKQVARLTTGPGPSDYRHYDGERTVTVEADVDADVVTPLEVTEAVFAHFDVDRDWAGMQISVGGEAFETEESMASLFRTFVIAIIAIYFLLVILFNSFTQPFLVMVAIPFGITGVVIAFGIHGEPFSFMAILGIIGLSGVVVNDSLVMVSHINDLKKQRKEENIRDLVAEGTADRLRAVILTTLTTVVALLPLAYGIGGTAVFMAPMALSLGWGLFFATPLTLILVPCLYMIGQDVSGVFRRTKTG